MKQLFPLFAAAAVVVLALNSARADAIPACFPGNERLGLIPNSATYNREAATPISTGSGVYSTDAGVQFYVGVSGELNVVPVAGSTTCPAAVEEVTLTVTDPWTGEQRTLSMKGTP